MTSNMLRLELPVYKGQVCILSVVEVVEPTTFIVFLVVELNVSLVEIHRETQVEVLRRVCNIYSGSGRLRLISHCFHWYSLVETVPRALRTTTFNTQLRIV